MQRTYPVPHEKIAKRRRRHDVCVVKLSNLLRQNGYATNRTPNYAGDLYAVKSDEVIIIEVKPLHPGSLNMQPIIHGVGQLIYYSYLFNKTPESKTRSLKLWLAFPYNEKIFKEYYYGERNYLDDLKSRAEPYLNQFKISLVPVEMMENEFYDPAFIEFLSSQEMSALG